MKVIKDYPNYSITKDGRVFNNKHNRYLKPFKRTGYWSVSLYEAGKMNSIRIHRLLAQAYIDNPENKPCVNHIDGDKTNNNISNLEWCTYKENTKHSWNTGLQKVSEKQRQAVRNVKRKLTDIEVVAIRELKGKVKQPVLAECYGVTQQSISYIQNNKRR